VHIYWVACRSFLIPAPPQCQVHIALNHWCLGLTRDINLVNKSHSSASQRTSNARRYLDCKVRPTDRSFLFRHLIQQASSEMYRASGNRRPKRFPTDHLVTSPGLSQPAVNLTTADPSMTASRCVPRMIAAGDLQDSCSNSSRSSPSAVPPHITHNAPPEPIGIPDSGNHSIHGKGEMRDQLLRLCVNVEDLATALVTNRILGRNALMFVAGESRSLLVYMSQFQVWSTGVIWIDLTCLLRMPMPVVLPKAFTYHLLVSTTRRIRYKGC
jgi:hypothetical protein